MNKEMVEFQTFFNTNKEIEDFINSSKTKIDFQKDGKEIFSNIEKSFEKIMKLNFLDDDLKKCVQDRFNVIKDNYLGDKHDNQEQAYEKFLVNVSDEVKSDVNEKLFGFSNGQNLNSSKECIEKSNSVNDLIYILESYVSHSSELWNDIPGNKRGSSTCIDIDKIYRRTICYSDNSNLGMSIYSALEYDRDLKKSYTPIDYGKDLEMLSLDGITLLLVNGRGSGLSVVIDERENKQNPLISYHIPCIQNKKICESLNNKENQIFNDDTKSVMGSYIEKRENIPDEIRKFILSVPLDIDKDFNIEDTVEFDAIKQLEPSRKAIMSEKIINNIKIPVENEFKVEEEFNVEDAKEMAESSKLTSVKHTIINLKQLANEIIKRVVDKIGGANEK